MRFVFILFMWNEICFKPFVQSFHQFTDYPLSDFLFPWKFPESVNKERYHEDDYKYWQKTILTQSYDYKYSQKRRTQKEKIKSVQYFFFRHSGFFIFLPEP